MIICSQALFAQCPTSVVENFGGNQYIFTASDCVGYGPPITNDDGTTYSFGGCVGGGPTTITYNFASPPAPTVLPSTFSFGGAIGDCSYDAGGNLVAPPQVPTLSEWGLLILALLFMTMGTLYLINDKVLAARKQ